MKVLLTSRKQLFAGLLTLLVYAIALPQTTLAKYSMKLPVFSFDMKTMQEYPIGYSSHGAAVPLTKQVKVLPAIPDSNGQIFMNHALETPLWEAFFKMELQLPENHTKLPQGKTDDLFSIWVLQNQVKFRKDYKARNIDFGLTKKFNGIGIFVFKEGSVYKLVALNDRGVESISIEKLVANFKEGENGCELKPEVLLDGEFQIKLEKRQN